MIYNLLKICNKKVDHILHHYYKNKLKLEYLIKKLLLYLLIYLIKQVELLKYLKIYLLY